MKKALLAIANGIILGIAGLGITNWQFWVLVIWMCILAATWSYLDECERKAEERYGPEFNKGRTR